MFEKLLKFNIPKENQRALYMLDMLVKIWRVASKRNMEIYYHLQFLLESLGILKD